MNRIVEIMADEELFREVGSGIWTLLAAFMCFGFLLYAWRWRRDWKSHATVFGALALALYFLGTSMRAAVHWGIAMSDRVSWMDPVPWQRVWPWYGMSIILSIAGVTWCVLIFGDYRTRWPLMAAIIGTSIITPILLLELIR